MNDADDNNDQTILMPLCICVEHGKEFSVYHPFSSITKSYYIIFRHIIIIITICNRPIFILIELNYTDIQLLM